MEGFNANFYGIPEADVNYDPQGLMINWNDLFGESESEDTLRMIEQFIPEAVAPLPVAAAPLPVAPLPVAAAPQQERYITLKKGKSGSVLYKVDSPYNRGQQYNYVVIRQEGPSKETIENRTYLFTKNAVEFAERHSGEVGFTNLQQPGKQREKALPANVQAFLVSRKSKDGVPLRRAVLKRTYEQKKKK
jgi:hypothetical protein